MPTESAQTVIVNTDTALELEPGIRHTLLVPGGDVHVIEFQDVSFGTDREIILPGLKLQDEDNTLGDPHASATNGDEDTPEIGAEAELFRALVTLFDFSRERPDKRVLLAGHTDTTGSQSHNLGLSERRAQNLFLYISGQREKWAQHAQTHHMVADWQTILKWLAVSGGWNTDPGAIDNDFGPSSRDARERFRSEFNERLGGSLRIEGKQRVGDWLAFYDLYDLELIRLLMGDAATLAERRKALSFADEPILACGETWPVEEIEADGFDSADNRRVDILFLDDETPFGLPGTPPGKPLYRNQLVHAFHVGFARDERETLLTSEIHLALRSNTGLMPIPRCRYRLRVGAELREGDTDALGRLRELLVLPGDYRLELDFDGRSLELLVPSRTAGLDPVVLIVDKATA